MVVTFSKQIEDLLFMGVIEGEAIFTLYCLLKSYEMGMIRAEEMQYEIDSFKSEFYRKSVQNQSYEC